MLAIHHNDMGHLHLHALTSFPNFPTGNVDDDHFIWPAELIDSALQRTDRDSEPCLVLRCHVAANGYYSIYGQRKLLTRLALSIWKKIVDFALYLEI